MKTLYKNYDLKGPGTSFQTTFHFLLYRYINRPNFITKLCLLPKIFIKMCFVFHPEAFDDVMTFEYLTSHNLKSFEVSLRVNEILHQSSCFLKVQNCLSIEINGCPEHLVKFSEKYLWSVPLLENWRQEEQMIRIFSPKLSFFRIHCF